MSKITFVYGLQFKPLAQRVADLERLVKQERQGNFEYRHRMDMNKREKTP